jgi:Tol biopolymer transport system component
MRRAQTLPILALLLAACAAQPGATTAPTAPPSSQPGTDAPDATPEPIASPSATAFEGHPAAGLALVRFPDPDNPASQIFVVDDDGSLRQVTGLDGGIGATFPRWSPDHFQIAFGPPKVGFPGINGQVSVINVDGSGERVLGVGEKQRWSPDGTRLIIHEKDDVTADPFEIWITDVATGEITVEIGPGFNGQWIDDETIGFTRIVATDDGSYSDALYIQVLDGSEPDQLGTEPLTEAVWSPDGGQVLLGHEGSIAVAQADGSNPRDLATGYQPVWSPDGTSVLLGYDTNQDGLPVLALVDLEGREIWSGVVGTYPTWSPDGTRIAVEIAYPEPMVQVIDAATGDLLWEIKGGSQPNWGSTFGGS